MKTPAKKAAFYGLLVALAFIMSYIENLLPLPVPAPGVKLGLANLVSMAALYLVGAGGAFGVSLIRILLAGLTFNGLSMMFYSLCGGILSLTVMCLLKKSGHFSVIGISWGSP